ncbi:MULTISPECIES: hypothetical protein [unclassified Acinetobacter]|uniref:hypothetical protein n=1 Tax=unclassified Acinetobacter TaxID=196816 RepID=UPI0015D1F450|nr:MULTISPECIES: hypothetical protein [unclassified Acinetobacter]
MKYLAIEPEGTKHIHFQLAGPSETWLLNGGYQTKFIGHVPCVRYSMPNKETLEIDSTGKMNAAAQKRYAIFLKQYLKVGKSLIESLRTQAPKILKVAA